MRFRVAVHVPFQFPPPRGGERLYLQPQGCRHSISIPAPARGRTGAPVRGVRRPYYFNSRPREGANRIDKDARIHDGISIPAPARGRTVRTARPARSGQFQFPPPRGGEHPAPSKNPVQRISIPAPARGRTGTGLTRHRGLEFQFPPPRGGEPPNWAGRGIPTRYFNSRPREGANHNSV